MKLLMIGAQKQHRRLQVHLPGELLSTACSGKGDAMNFAWICSEVRLPSHVPGCAFLRSVAAEEGAQ